jgi:hypothetical protein
MHPGIRPPIAARELSTLAGGGMRPAIRRPSRLVSYPRWPGSGPMTTHPCEGPAPAETGAQRHIRSLIRSLLYRAIRVSG